MFSHEDPYFDESEYNSSVDTFSSSSPLFSKRTLIATVISATVVVLVFLSIEIIGIFYALDLFDVYTPNNQPFERKIVIQNIMGHLNQLNEIAKQYSNSRAMDLGYNASLDYVENQLKQYPDFFTIQRHCFTVTQVFDAEVPQFYQTEPSSVTFTAGIDFKTITYSGSGDVKDYVTFVQSGCSVSDYTSANFVSGIALALYTSDCRTVDIATIATQMNVTGLLIYSEQTGLFSSSAKNPVTYPIFSLSSEVGTSIRQTIAIGTAVQVRMVSDTTEQISYTCDLLADTPGNDANIIVSGSHLDSVPAGPGINDNGSGSAANLEIALQYAILNAKPANKIRFAWWAAEELGLKGSTAYVQSLSTTELDKIACNVNYDMLGSPNFIRGIYNGSAAEINIRPQCKTIMNLYVKFFESLKLPYDFTPFTGRSDYGPFLDKNIPAGGLFSGAEELKTELQREKYGGIANMAYDTCYHKACDSVDNINRDALEEMAQAAAYVVYQLSIQANLQTFLTNNQ